MGEREELIGDLRAYADYLGSLTEIGADRSAFARAAPAAAGVVAAVVAPPADPAAALQAIREDLGECQRCKLHATRTHVVFGQGSPSARLMFIGEAPGADEDEQGLAFVGKAGQLLTKIIEAMGMSRDEVFITNILKSRPPNNRNPEPDEILACQGFLDQQIDAIRPRVIVALGKFSAHWLLKTAEPITRLRGRMGEYKGITVMPTYHPAYLLRTPSAKKELWEDMKVVRALLAE
jgi:uracil-DNA glycosylase family 4